MRLMEALEKLEYSRIARSGAGRCKSSLSGQGSCDRTGISSWHYYAFDTYQFDDYNKYVSDWFSEAEKATYKKQHWAADREAAYELGKKVMVSMSHRKSK